MGIQNFNTWIKSTYPNCVYKSRPKKYNHIYIDLNFILHNSIYKSSNEREFLTNLYSALDDIIGIYTVLESITIAVDGPSPYSKINLQRKRRLQMLNGKVDVEHLNSLHLTPGTKFMINLDKHIDSYIEHRKKWFKYRDVKFNVYSTSEAGEGEIKLLKSLITNGKNDNASHLIVGNDADLVVISMSLYNIDKIDILVKTPGEYNIVSINKLITAHCKKYGEVDKIDPIGLKLLPIRQDFAVVSTMMGNDYLPKLSFVKFEKLWDAYRTTRKVTKRFLMNGYKFDIVFLKEFLINVNLNLPVQFKATCLQKYTDYGEKNMMHYLRGLLWCFKMYNTGNCPMYNYVFDTSCAPSPTNLLFFLEKGNLNISVPESAVKPLDVYACAILLLPKKAYKLLPEKYHYLVQNKLTPYYEMEECNTCYNFKQKIKKLNEAIYEGRKVDKVCTNEKNLVRRYNDEYANHKEIHINDYTIEKVRYIIEEYEDKLKKNAKFI